MCSSDLKTTLYPGERFNANIVMAAVDTTQQPEIYVNGMRVNTAHGQYSFTAGGVGEHQFSGYILMHNAKGDVLRRNFLQKYSVIPAPNTATVAADMMNVLYAGFHNPISISVRNVYPVQIRLFPIPDSLLPHNHFHCSGELAGNAIRTNCLDMRNVEATVSGQTAEFLALTL